MPMRVDAAATGVRRQRLTRTVTRGPSAPDKRGVPPARARSVERLADDVLASVRTADVGGQRGDTSGLLMLAAYVQGFRRLAAIRRLAGERAGAEAMILTRTLLSMAARAAYADAPTEPSERRRRFLSQKAKELREELRALKRLRELSVAVERYDERVAECVADLSKIGDVGAYPDDTTLMREHLNLASFHARIYPTGSEHIHFSQGVALRELIDTETVDLDAGDADLAADALLLAVITYGLLLELSERALRHGLTERVAHLIREALTTLGYYDDAPP